MVDRCTPQAAFELGDQFEVAIHILERRMRGFEVARIGQAVGSDRAEVGQLQQRTVVLADVATARAIGQFNAEAHAARDHRDLLRLDLDHAQLGQQAQRAQLRHDQQLAVGVVEVAADHIAVGGVQVNDTGMRVGRAVATHCTGPRRSPSAAQAAAADSSAAGSARPAVRRNHSAAATARTGELAMGHRRADPVQPAAAVAATRRGEGGAGQLFGVQAVGHLLR